MWNVTIVCDRSKVEKIHEKSSFICACFGFFDSYELIRKLFASVRGLFLGADSKPVGSFCCVEQTCVITKSEADCKKIGGENIKSCEECEKPLQK